MIKGEKERHQKRHTARRRLGKEIRVKKERGRGKRNSKIEKRWREIRRQMREERRVTKG